MNRPARRRIALRHGERVIIKISSNGKGAWNLHAKERDDDTSPLIYTALGRSPWAIKALVNGILTDHQPDTAQNDTEVS